MKWAVLRWVPSSRGRIAGFEVVQAWEGEGEEGGERAFVLACEMRRAQPKLILREWDDGWGGETAFIPLAKIGDEDPDAETVPTSSKPSRLGEVADVLREMGGLWGAVTTTQIEDALGTPRRGVQQTNQNKSDIGHFYS